MIATKDVETILGIISQADLDFGYANAVIRECDEETQDILHDLELVPHTHNERGRLAKRLAEVRKIRREAKDAAETLNPFVDWVVDNQHAVNRLKETLGAMRKRDILHTNRVYFRRAGENKGEMIVGDNKRG